MLDRSLPANPLAVAGDVLGVEREGVDERMKIAAIPRGDQLSDTLLAVGPFHVEGKGVGSKITMLGVQSGNQQSNFRTLRGRIKQWSVG